MITVFTEKYKTIQRKLINSAVIEFNGNYLPAKAQWDTGATGTCISKQVVAKLGLQPTGMINVQTPSGIGTMNKYMVNLTLNNKLTILDFPVMDSEIGSQGIDVLIGMDIISIGDFAVSNFEGRTQFSFRIPSQEHVEFLR